MKMKDLRGWFFTFLLLGLDAIAIVYSISIASKAKLIISLFTLPFILMGIFTQFIIRVSNDFMLLYRFILFIAFPVIINFNDITDIELVNKNKIVIKAKHKKYPIYVLNAAKRYLDIKEKWSEYNA